jgi:[acyl-carrier-protein] S-malonyltransferase
MQKIAHLFPGQGIQKVGMGKFFSRRVETLLTENDPKLLELTWVGPQEELNKTINAQPAITLMQVSLAEDLDKPEIAVGHSLGEYAALWEAGVWDLETLYKVVRARGYYMQELCPDGWLIALRNKETADTVVNAFKGKVFYSNINSDRQVLIGGLEQDLPEVEAFMKEERIAYKRIQGNKPFHTPYLENASKEFYEFLKSVKGNDPEFDVYLNIADDVVSNYNEIIELLARSLANPVDWTRTVAFLESRNLDMLVEINLEPLLAKLTSQKVVLVHEVASI